MHRRETRIRRMVMVALLVSAAVLLLASPTVAFSPAQAWGTDPNGAMIRMVVRLNGQKVASDVTGDGAIEVISYQHSVTTAREAGSGLATGRRQYQPLLIRKRIDKASPLLMKAMTEGQRVDAELQFFRPSPSRNGTVEHYYTITITGGRVLSNSQAGGPDAAESEEISFTFQKISWTYTNGGVTHEDTWDQQR